MFSITSKKYRPANFVFAAQFTEGADAKSVQETINCYLSMFSRFTMTGTRDPKAYDGTLSWNLMGLGMDSDFDVDRFLDDMSNHISGVDGVSALILNDGAIRHYSTPGMSVAKKSALDLQCYVQMDMGNNPNQSLSIN